MRHKIFTSAFSRIALSLTVTMGLASLTACGSGGKPGSNQLGTTITASFSGQTLPQAVAYQVGMTGTFQTIGLSDSTATFTLPSGTDAYGVAYICPTFLDGYYFSNTSIIQATTADTTSLALSCPSLLGAVNATYDVSAIPGVLSVDLYAGYLSTETNGTTGSVEVSGIPTGTVDVALVARGSNGPIGVQIQRGVTVASLNNTNITFPPMTTADEVGTSAPVSVTGVPSGATTSGFATKYNTAGGLSIDFNSLSPSSHPTVPSSQSHAGDYYLIEGIGILPYQVVTSEITANATSAVTVKLPAPLSSTPAPTPAAYPTFQVNTSGFTVAGPVVNSAAIQYQLTPGIENPFYNVYAYVTQSWLGANTTFTVPNLSTVAGFAAAPPSGLQEDWIFYSTAGTPLQFNPLQQTGAESLTSGMSVQSMTYYGGFRTP